MSNLIWTYIEQEGGKAHPVSWELLGAARKLSHDLADSTVECVLLGENVEPIIDQAFSHGAARVYVIDDSVLSHYRNLPYSFGIANLIKQYQPAIFLVGASTLGRDLASSIATRVSTGLTADCTELAIDKDKKILAATRPTFGGNLMATILCKTRRPQMATVRPRVLPTPQPLNEWQRGEVIRESLGMTEEDVAVKLLRFIPGEEEEEIEYADVVVAGGRGVGGAKGFAMLQELADALGGVVGASRPAVDAGWITYAHQVGQTGKTIRPKLYIAAGISGAIQHRVGVMGSDFILAINNDPNAPIFGVADFGIVGDLNTVIPELTKQVKAARAAQ
jgi:electron transfer flavoprotein alpha subunit